jgi:hypothetical protein
MTNGLAQALNGNFASLTRVGFVLDENTKKQIKSGTETERANALVKVLNSTYKDFNKNLRATDAGQMQVLANSAQEATTIIGTGLLDALRAVGRDNSIENLALSMEGAALASADFIRGLGQIASFEVSGETKSLIGLLTTPFQRSFSAGPLGAITRLGSGSRRGAEVAAQQNPIQSGTYLKNQKVITKLAQTQTKAAQETLKLAKAKSLFDLQKIQIEAALKGRISEEDRIRLKLMQAIESENIDQIDKYTKMLDQAQKNTEKLVSTLASIKPLDDVFKNWNFMSVKEQLAGLETYFKNFAGTAASAFASLGAAQRASLGGFVPFVGASIPSVAGTSTSMPSTVGLGTSGTGNQLPAGVTIATTVNTGIGDPETIARAVEDVIRQAVGRGTSSLLLPI